MTTRSALLACLGLALAASTRFAVAAAPAPEARDSPERAAPVAASAHADPAQRAGETDEAGFFTEGKICLLLGTLGAFVLVARRRGVD